jgi:hypothetical protein
MKKPTTKVSDDECKILGEDCPRAGKTKRDLLRRKVKRISPGKGKLVSELIREMRC